MLYLVARILTSINYRLDHPKRESVLANLRVILGPRASERRVVRESRLVFYNFGKFLAEFFGFERFGGPFIDENFDIVGDDLIRGALAEGRGAILNASHLSNWEIGAAGLARRGYPVTAVAQRHSDPVLNEYFNRQRRSRGYDVMPSEGAFLKCIAALKRNEVVCFVGDRDIGLGSIEVEFFGRPTLLPQGPARIALASGAPIFPTFILRRSNDAFVMRIDPAIPVPESGSRREKARAMTQRFANEVERYVRMFPAQWGVFHKYWPAPGESVETGAVM